jgi:signal peptidase II|nr:signal peptidase II [Kofleriaceae bacterium]
MRRWWLGFAIVVAVTFGLDQGSKAWARSSLPANQPQPVIHGYWDWELAENPGAAFSSFPDGSARVALSLVAIAAIAGITYLVARTRPEQRVQRAAYAMLAGGALGNLVDRLRHGTVTDFVRWHADTHMWPVFNVADCALVIGVAMLVADSLLVSRRRAAAV